MHYVILFFLAVILTACGTAGGLGGATQESPGCTNINDPFYDRQYQAGNVFFSPFKAGERVSVETADPTAFGTPTATWLIVTDTTVTPERVLATQTADLDDPLSYVFSEDRAEVEIYWTVDTGATTWTVSCSRVGE